MWGLVSLRVTDLAPHVVVGRQSTGKCAYCAWTDTAAAAAAAGDSVDFVSRSMFLMSSAPVKGCKWELGTLQEAITAVCVHDCSRVKNFAPSVSPYNGNIGPFSPMWLCWWLGCMILVPKQRIWSPSAHKQTTGIFISISLPLWLSLTSDTSFVVSAVVSKCSIKVISIYKICCELHLVNSFSGNSRLGTGFALLTVIFTDAFFAFVFFTSKSSRLLVVHARPLNGLIQSWTPARM